MRLENTDRHNHFPTEGRLQLAFDRADRHLLQLSQPGFEPIECFSEPRRPRNACGDQIGRPLHHQ